MTDMSNDELRRQLAENTRITNAIHRVILGEEEFQRPGLLDDVRGIREDMKDMKGTILKHDRILIRYGGTLAGVVVAWELAKVFLFKTI